jgi:hypothetical protein
VADVQYPGSARRPRLLPALWELWVACVCARKRLPPITFRLRETIGCFIASDYVSKRPTRNNRHVLAAQKGRFVDYHRTHMLAAVSHQLCTELLSALHWFWNRTGNRWTPLDILRSAFQNQSNKFKYLGRNPFFYH